MEPTACLRRRNADKAELLAADRRRFVDARFCRDRDICVGFETRHRDSFYITQITMCEGTLRIQNDALQGLGTQEDRAEKEAANQSEYGQCKKEADATWRETSDANLKHMPIFLATVLGLIVIAWLIEWITVDIARWIARSSQKSRRTECIDR